jgi:succinate-acetate transporter protein
MKSGIISPKDPNKKELLDDNQLENFLNKVNKTNLLINRLDYYGNSIPLGAFCYAVGFVLYGFYECKVFKLLDTFTFSALLLFGGVGQVTAGIFEFIKSRTFPTIVYLVYGLYFISFFLLYYYKAQLFHIQDYLRIFYGTWAGLSFPLIIGSFKSNLIYLLQNASACAFFIIRCIGECKNLETLNTTVSGILELVTGFLSLYICFSQILNEHYRCTILPTFQLKKDNEIDDNKIENN